MMFSRRMLPGLMAAGLAAFAGLAGSARAQVPQPEVPDIEQRSGLLGRFIPIQPHLPPDPKRDNFYDTRFGDAPNERPHPNFYTNGGLYGLRWRSTDTRSFYPYFYGSPGQSTLTENSRPYPRPFRLAGSFLHPYKPICHYYDQGSYVPLYDLDPLVPGPGARFNPFYRRITSAGG